MWLRLQTGWRFCSVCECHYACRDYDLASRILNDQQKNDLELFLLLPNYRPLGGEFCAANSRRRILQVHSVRSNSPAIPRCHRETLDSGQAPSVHSPGRPRWEDPDEALDLAST